MAQNARAMTNLGCCYESGEGIARDVAAAAQWYRCAAQLGAPVDRVQHAACAVCARHGTCRAQRIALGTVGDSDAAANLGRCYWRGEGVRADVVEAVSW